MALITEEQRAVIVSEEYANLIIDYRNNPLILERIPNSTVQIMNEVYAVVYIPVSQFLRGGMEVYRYSSIPKLYGLTSEIALEASGVNRLRNIPDFNLKGSGVLIGVLDTGINFNLSIFKNADGTSRIYSLWDQTVESDRYPMPAMFGTEYNTDQINEAILAENPQSIVQSIDENGHGTTLAGVAAGLEVTEYNFAGVAPESELVVVKLRPAKKYLRDYFIIPDNAVCFQEDYIMWGIQYCIRVARNANRPIAICLGLGTSQGAHDGRTNLSRFSSILARFPRTGITVSTGNEGNLGRHFHGIINPMIGNTTVELNVAENEVGFSMELWGDAPGIYSIDILSPSGEYIPRIAASLYVSREVAFIFENTVIHVEYQTVENETGDQLILFRFNDVAAGTWKFTVYGQGDLATGFHIWLPMGDLISKDTRFNQANIYTTILSPGDADAVLTVTAYNPLNQALYVNASRGYTRGSDIKPELAAPGVNYIAPDKEGIFTPHSGTGVAAAHATGIVALVLEWGVTMGNQPNMNTLEIKNYFIRAAMRSSNLSYPNRDWGYGMINIYNTFDILRISL